MTGQDLVALLPLIVLAASSLLLLLLIAAKRHHGLVASTTAVGMVATLAALWPAAARAPREVTPLMVVDGFGLLYSGVLAGATLMVVGLAYGYLEDRGEAQEELYVLLVLATLGAAVLVQSRHFASLFLGLETLSIALYVLIAYHRADPKAAQAGIKYLLLAGASSAILLLGLAFIYADAGTMAFGPLRERMAAGEVRPEWILAGLALVVTGAGFKLAAVPFHLWVPDVYEGASAPVTAFVATVSKGAMLALLVRMFFELDVLGVQPLVLALGLMAMASILAGNFLALLQRNLKRLLAYSSIAHMGYLLVAFVSAGSLALEAVTFYVVAYFVTIASAFGIVSVLAEPDGEHADLEDYRGLFWRRPLLAALLSITLLSLGGIPLTAGFIGKYYVVLAGVGAELWAPLLVLVAGSVVGLFYYLRVITVLFAEPAADAVGRRIPLSGGVTLAALAGLLLWLGVVPGPFIDLVRWSALP